MINKVMEKNVAERRELYDEYSSLEPRVMIERLDSSGKIDPFNALTIEEKSEHLVIEEPVTIKSNYEYKQPIEPIVSEDYGQIKKDEKVIYWLPREICLVNIFVYFFISYYCRLAWKNIFIYDDLVLNK